MHYGKKRLPRRIHRDRKRVRIKDEGADKYRFPIEIFDDGAERCSRSRLEVTPPGIKREDPATIGCKGNVSIPKLLADRQPFRTYRSPNTVCWVELAKTSRFCQPSAPC